MSGGGCSYGRSGLQSYWLMSDEVCLEYFLQQSPAEALGGTHTTSLVYHNGILALAG